MTVNHELPRTSNQQALLAALDELRARLDPKFATAGGPAESGPEPVAAGEPQAPPSPGALDDLVLRFRLSAFERGILLLCAGIELDSRFANLCALAQNGQRCATFGLALAVLPEPHWSALTPTGALRSWRLLELDPAAGLTTAPLRIDERILHHLVGVPYFEPRLKGLFSLVPDPKDDLTPRQTAQAQRILDQLADAQRTGEAPLFVLQGNDLSARNAVAAAACSACGLKLYQVPAEHLPTQPEERAAVARLWEREALLGSAALLISTGEDAAPELLARSNSFAEHLGGIVFHSGPSVPQFAARKILILTVDKPAVDEQLALWNRILGPAATRLNGQLARVATQFSLDARGVQVAAEEFARRASSVSDPNEASPLLWSAARQQARVPLDSLAQAIEPSARWEDIVLPAPQLHTLRTIVAQVRQRARVCESWGFARKGARGLGLSALFAGPSGTGKTMAAEVLARELDLDLYRIDLSAMVSKYLGETEKNLRRVFDAADLSGAILLFDEADALFGKRSEVRDSHDRHANIEVSYLLQRIEAYRGLAILTTNMKQSLDNAFTRRLRFIVPFSFPDTSQRLEIWRRVFPAETPTDNLDYAKLARLSLAGGHIRNVALNAAFLAADAGEPVRMSHLQQAAQSEYTKLEKPLSESEFGGWS